jgi:Holliday junction DNA helicase RuvA
MIGKIKGKLVEVDQNIGLIETAGGLSYLVYLTPFLLSSHPVGANVEIYTYLQVKEDDLVLFGFRDKKEIDFFKMLLTVPGVGPKTAFSVISFSDVDKLKAAVEENNPDFFYQIPGLGKKTALKIILELSQKLKTEFELKKMYLSDEDKLVVDALTSLGFNTNIVKKILPQLPKNLSIEEKIKKALKMIK